LLPRVSLAIPVAVVVIMACAPVRSLAAWPAARDVAVVAPRSKREANDATSVTAADPEEFRGVRWGHVAG
jgi:hypothetical protein